MKTKNIVFLWLVSMAVGLFVACDHSEEMANSEQESHSDFKYNHLVQGIDSLLRLSYGEANKLKSSGRVLSDSSLIAFISERFQSGIEEYHASRKAQGLETVTPVSEEVSAPYLKSLEESLTSPAFEEYEKSEYLAAVDSLTNLIVSRAKNDGELTDAQRESLVAELKIASNLYATNLDLGENLFLGEEESNLRRC
ncbi:MAG: hypothetical protein HC842_05840 [Cytophagales bacterium]|nr:hypothetical protein [Cytophagales bacterium]